MIQNDAGGKPRELPPPVAELSARYPARASSEWSLLVSRIVASAEPELARRRGERAVVRSILRDQLCASSASSAAKSSNARLVV